ncbi:hypothetical protein AAG570_010103 [Ranatra chinensis]|uniref:Phosphopantothenoylcysteine decarboxylase n=1 Tax=Ranatra chinensis TaxID=642074 RepID=A0ABD0YLK6_9HEMI
MTSEIEINVLLCCTGSVATIKLPLLITTLLERSKSTCRLDMKVCMTERAKHFCAPKELEGLVEVYSDEDEWTAWRRRGDPVLHIALAKWADIVVIAPLDANTLGKMASGICDNIVTCVVRAWDLKKPLLFCPAMNTLMWQHPITGKQVATLESWGYRQVACIEKTLMCGDTGLGAMAEPMDIADEVMARIAEVKKIKGTPV